MQRRKLLLIAAIAVPATAVVAIPTSRQAAWRAIVPRASAEAAPAHLEAVLADRKLHAILPSGEARTYDVAIGTRNYPTPTGTFTIRRIVWNPGWVPPASPWARGKKARGPKDPGNPMKVAKIFFKQPDYYIHGTGHVESLGTAASHGCLRMHPDEVAELGAALMQVGGVAHDWDWVKNTLRMGKTRTINLKSPIRITILAQRPEPVMPPATPIDSSIVPAMDSVLGPVPVDSVRTDTLPTTTDTTRRPR